VLTITITLNTKQHNKLPTQQHKQFCCQRLAMSRSSHRVAPLHAQILFGFSNKPEALAMMPQATLDNIALIHVTKAQPITIIYFT